MTRLWIATGHGKPGLFSEEQPLPAALAEHGIDATPARWQDIRPDGTPILVRTTWDYTQDRDGFRAWFDAIDAAGGPCFNPTARMRWNLDKRYLLELEEAGHAIVPTRTLDAYDADALADVARAEGWTRAIAKPVIGAAAQGLVYWDGKPRTFDTSGNTWTPGAKELPDGPILVQPFLPAVRDGEWSLFFFAGRFSHAILKRPKDGDIRVQEEHGGSTVGADPPAHVRQAAQAIVEDVPDALYARVDGLVVDGRFLLMELELIEPELYFRYAPGSLERFATALAGALA